MGEGVTKGIRLAAVLSMIVILSWNCEINNRKRLINILIISGKNNHKWIKTTPLLERIYKETGLFKTDVTDYPDTLNFTSLREYDVIVSNWNTWPDNYIRLKQEWEADFIQYIKEGGGAVFIHAGASSFYTWDEYHSIEIGRWGKETSHGKPQRGKVYGFDKKHPITSGLKDFCIVDELWKKTDIHPNAVAIASVTWNDESGEHQRSENAAFTNQTGKGRSFYTILGHDERALLNTGLKTLLLRGTIWAARRKINTEIPAALKLSGNEIEKALNWDRSDTAISLKRGRNIIWQYNFNNRYGKQYFHPLNAGTSALTCVSPPDHPWHMGLWFSWKFMNGVNYWEYLNEFKSEETGYKSEGINSILNLESEINSDFSADINLDIVYQPIEGIPVMSERCLLHISPPSADGSYFIDFDHTFSPITGEVILDRTPIEGESGGQSWGGYSGLSIRFNQDFTAPFILAPTDSADYKKNSWVYMGFNTLTGDTAGVSIMQNPEFTTTNTSWYIIRNPDIPFFYYSPAVLYDGKIILKKGEKLHLKYRVWIIPGKTTMEELEKKYNEFVN